MGRALAERALAVVGLDSPDAADSRGQLDLTAMESPAAPEHVRQAAKEALARGETHYTVRPGVPELRSAIAARSTRDGFPATTDSVVVTNGGAEALYIALQATLKAGDRLLLAGPVAPNIREMVSFIGAEVVEISDSDEIGSVTGSDSSNGSTTTALLLTTSSPFTGVDVSIADIQRLVTAAAAAGVVVILDRSSADCRYDAARQTFDDPELGTGVLTVGSLSTSHNLAGWRVGYFTAPASHMSAMRELKQAMSICTTAVSQFAALAALEGPGDWLDERRASYAQRRDATIARLQSAGLEAIVPDSFPSLLIDVRSIDTDDRVVADRLQTEDGVIVDPGSSFGEAFSGHIRINLGAPEQTLTEGVERIAALAERGRS